MSQVALNVAIKLLNLFLIPFGNYHFVLTNGLMSERALEELDSLLLHASRNEPGASVKSMKSNIGIAVSALNR